MDLVDAHARMVRDLYLQTEQRFNRGFADPPEYDSQQLISDFYQFWLRNTEYSAHRERAGRTDILLRDGNDDRVFYEIKTYFKPKERIAADPLYKDAKKLAGKLSANPMQRKAYLLLAGSKKKLFRPSVPTFVKAHVKNDRSYFSLPAANAVKLRPSRKQIPAGETFVLTWEVLLEEE